MSGNGLRRSEAGAGEKGPTVPLPLLLPCVKAAASRGGPTGLCRSFRKAPRGVQEPLAGRLPFRANLGEVEANNECEEWIVAGVGLGAREPDPQQC